MKEEMEERTMALEWWNTHSDREKLELSLKHYDVLDLNIGQIVFAWRRSTGGIDVIKQLKRQQ